MDTNINENFNHDKESIIYNSDGINFVLKNNKINNNKINNNNPTVMTHNISKPLIVFPNIDYTRKYEYNGC